MDFIRVYADRCRHGKEEDILFRKLKEYPLSGEHRQITEEALHEHKQGRRVVAEMIEAKRQYVLGKEDMLDVARNCKEFMTECYPKTDRKRGQTLFRSAWTISPQKNKDAALKEGWDYDRNLIHEVYEERMGIWAANSGREGGNL